MAENQVDLSNGLKVSIDWLAFTVTLYSSVDDVVQFVGLSPEQFKDMPNGANGYKRMMKYNGISVLFDGTDNMGIHVSVPGSAVGIFFEAYKNSLCFDSPFGVAFDLWDDTVVSKFFTALLQIGQLSRLDLAVDDIGAKYYSVDDVAEKIENGNIVSKWRTSRSLKENIISHNETIGNTLYFGSAQSDVMLRVYDKKLERNKNLLPEDENYIDHEWVRWELELHKERATLAAQSLADGVSIGEVTIGILSNYVRIVYGNDLNKSRRPMEDTWQRFIDDIQTLRITMKKEMRTYSDFESWFDRGMGKSVAKIVYMNGGEVGYFADLASRYKCKFTTQDVEQLISAEKNGVETIWQKTIKNQKDIEEMGVKFNDL